MKKITSIISILLLMSILSINVWAYDNPLPFFDQNKKQAAMGDPFVMKYNGTYYCYVSGGYCFRSTDMVKWTAVGNIYTGAHSDNLFAPEVFYWNGAFYTISSPNGTTNYLFKSNSPEGPFTAISGDLGGDIDGSLFRDDDGTIYFTHAAWNGIKLYRMETPESPLELIGTLSPSMSEMWTEGPSIFKRDGKYYMTFTGNHVLDQAYRIEYAMSDSITEGWVEPDQNILLLATEGETVSLGHNSVVIGPDLDTYYIVYHNRYPDGTKPIDRGFNMQRVLWNEEKMTVSLNLHDIDNPDAPDFEYRPQGGTEQLVAKKLSEQSTDDVFTAEFNVVPDESQILFSYVDENNFCSITFSNGNLVLRTLKDGNATSQSVPLAKNTATDCLQCVRVQQTETSLRIYLEGGLLMKTDIQSRGKIGYAGGTVGYMAFSNKALGNQDHTAQKIVSATYDAVLANNQAELTKINSQELGSSVLMKAGESASFLIDIYNNLNASLTLRGRASSNTVLNVLVDGERLIERVVFAESTVYRSEILRSIPFLIGEHSIEIEVVSGEFEFYELTTVVEAKVQARTIDMQTTAHSILSHEGEHVYEDGKLKLEAVASPKGDHLFAKSMFGKAGWGDYSIEAKIALNDTKTNTEAGIVIRSVNASDGEASAFRFRQKWYQQCYYVAISEGWVRLYKQNYNEQVLARARITDDVTKENILKVSVVGDVITVYLNGNKLFTYTDTNHPFTNGKAGLKVVNCTATFDDLTIEPLSATTQYANDKHVQEVIPPMSDGADANIWREYGMTIGIALGVTSLLFGVVVVAYKRLRKRVK